MKEYVIALLFLLLDLSISNGHTLAKIEMNNKTDVYEVKERQSSLAITHPKDEKTTLRELIYFHVIERPYDSGYDEVVHKTPESTRSFTNGHGFQYNIEADNEKTTVINEQELGDDNDSELPNEESENNETYENDGNQDNERNETETKATNPTDKPKDETEDDSDDDIELIDIYNEDEMGTGDDTVVNKNQPIEDNLDVRFGEVDTNNTGVKEDMGDSKDEPESRRKRQIDYTNLPDAPSLPEFKLDILPDNIKAILLDEPETYQKANLEDEIEKQVRDLEEVVDHPPSVDKSNQKRETRTYGMSLTGDRGVVWNDVNTGHLSYHVGEPEIVTSTTMRPEEVPNTTRTTTTAKTNEPTEKASSEEYHNGNDNESKDENTDSDELKDIEASFDEINKLLAELIKEANKEPEVNDSSQENTPKTPDIQNDRTSISITLTTESTNENTGFEDKPSTDKPDIGNPGDNKKSNDRRDNQNKDDSRQKEFVKELMKNKYFWQWLQDSSTAYLEIMMKRVDVLIKTEVEKQIKQYFEDHKNVGNCNTDSINTVQITTAEEPIQISNDTDVNKINITQQPIMNMTSETAIETSNNTDVLEITEKPSLNDTEQNNIASSNTQIDEPMKNGNKTEEELARKHNNKELDDKKKETSVQIEAQQVYGSSVGNSKVTNIFIFNIGKESDLAHIKPLSNGTDGVFVFGLDNKPDKEKVDEDHKVDNKTEMSTDITTIPQATNDHKDSNAESDIILPEIQANNSKPETEPVIDEMKENITEVLTSKNEDITTEKQTTLKEPSDESTKNPNDYIESATSATEKDKELTTEATTESSKEGENQTEKTEKLNTTESDSTTSDNEPKHTNKNSTNDSYEESNESKREETKGTDDTNTTESTKASAEVKTDDKSETDKENKIEKENNEIDHKD